MGSNTTLDENVLQWCNGNYELVYSSLQHLRKCSRRAAHNATGRDDDNPGFLRRFFNRCRKENTKTANDGDLNDGHSDSDMAPYDEEYLDDLFEPSNQADGQTNLEELKNSVRECITKCNFHRPRLVPKRRHNMTIDQLCQYVAARFKDLLENVDKIDEFSKICNVDQLLCAELLCEGLFYYGVNDSQNMPEFTIIENMLYRQTLFQLRSIITLFAFVNRGDYSTSGSMEQDPVFPEARAVVKQLADNGLVRNLYMLILSAMRETHRFHQARARAAKPAPTSPFSSQDSQDELRARANGEDLDLELMLRHHALYLNTLLELLAAYYTAFSPTEQDLRWLLALLPHVFDFAKMFKLPDFTNSLNFLFDNYKGDELSSYYPSALKYAATWVSVAEFDRDCGTNLTEKLMNVYLVLVNTKIYRLDADLRPVRLDGTIVNLVKMNPHALLYRGLFDETYDPEFKPEDNFGPSLGLESNKRKAELARFDERKLKELEETRTKGADIELLVDFVVYGVYMEDGHKIMAGFSRNVLELMLRKHGALAENAGGFDAGYLHVYNRLVKLVFTPLLADGELLTKTWFELVSYEITCRRKLEALSREVVGDEVNTAVFREPGTCFIHLLQLFAKAYSERDAEFLYQVLKSVAESYRAVVPDRTSLLFVDRSRGFNAEYYQVADKDEDDAGWNGAGARSAKTRKGTDNIKLKARDLDHQLMFPNAGFSWHERNSALLELVSMACNKRNVFVETYPRLMVEILEFAVILAGFPKVAPKLANFLNSGASRDVQFPTLLQRVVTQLKCLNRGDFDALPELVYQQIIARDDRIETSEAAMQIVTLMPPDYTEDGAVADIDDTKAYLQEYFKKSRLRPNSELYGAKPYTDLYAAHREMVKREYLDDVERYRIRGGKRDLERETQLSKRLKTDATARRTRHYTFPLVNSAKEARKALSNLGLGGTLPSGLVEVASLVFRLVVTIDPLIPHSHGARTGDPWRRDPRHDAGHTGNRLTVKFGNYTYLETLFSILSTQHTRGTERLVGSLLRSLASVHVTDARVCRLALVKLTQLLYDPESTLGRKLTFYELSNLMYCVTSLLVYLPARERYAKHDGDTDYLLELVKYIIELLHDEPTLSGRRTGHPASADRFESDADYYAMMDNIFSFLLMVSRGPLGQKNASRATQYLYEQVLLPGSSLAFLLVKCANEAKLTTAVALVCNVFKRDFLVATLHKISKFNLNKELKCPNCNYSRGQELALRAETPKSGRFTWFLNRMNPMKRDRRAAPYRNADRNAGAAVPATDGRPAEGCEVCRDLDFDQRPLSLLMAHEAFLEALSAYSPDLRCDLIGHFSRRDAELRVRTLYILVQFAKRGCKLYLSSKLVTKFKCYLYRATTGGSTMPSLLSGEGCAEAQSADDDAEFYHVINDPDMEALDLKLYNKLRHLVTVDYDAMASYANLRELNSCTFNTLVTYYFSLNPELQLKVVDERLFLSMVNACAEEWSPGSWHKVHIIAMVARLISDPRLSKLLLLSWPTVFQQVQKFQFDRSSCNLAVLNYLKLAHMMEIVKHYAPVLNEMQAGDGAAGRQAKPAHAEELGGDTDGDLLRLMDLGGLNFTLLTFNLVNNFCEYELLLHNNIASRANQLGPGNLSRLWRYNAYPVHANGTAVKMLSHQAMELGGGTYPEMEEYTTLVEMYNGLLAAFTTAFKSLLDMFEAFTLTTFDSLFDYLEANEPNHEFKVVLQLAVIKRIHKGRQTSLLVNVLVKLLNYLLEGRDSHPLLKAKVYHMINHFVRAGPGAEGADDAELVKVLISHLSQQPRGRSMLSVLFRDAVANHELYEDLDVLGHVVGTDNARALVEGHRNGDHEAGYARDEDDLARSRLRCVESLYYALERQNLNCTVEAMKLLSSIVRGLGQFEATEVEYDRGKLVYGPVGTLSVERVKKLIKARLLVNFYLCKHCQMTPPLCGACSDTLVAALNVLRSVCTVHQFSSFWFSIRVDENENLSDLFLRSAFLSLFAAKASTELLLPTLFVVEHLLSTTSIKTRNAIVTWLNQHADLLLANAAGQVEDAAREGHNGVTPKAAHTIDNDTTLYVCCLLRVYRISFLWLLSDYRAMNEFRGNFALILADLHCKFPLASTLPRLVPKLITYFAGHLDLSLNWLGLLLCLQTLFPELGAFEMNLNFATQVPIKTKALDMLKMLVDVMLRAAAELLAFIQQYSAVYNYTPPVNQLGDFPDAELGGASSHAEAVESLNNALVLKLVTLDCVVILLEYILSLLKLPNAVGANHASRAGTAPIGALGLKVEETDRLKSTIEKLAKVCSANGASLMLRGHSRENSVEFLAPYQLEHVPSLFQQYSHSHRALFSTLLTSLLNLDSILESYT